MIDSTLPSSLSHAIDRAIDDQWSLLVDIRRDLHAHPELSWQEHRTAGVIEAQLDAWGIPHQRVVGTGVIVDIAGPTSSKNAAPVIYRADIDALPLQDTKDPNVVSYASQNEGVCHACGHDVHTTIGLSVCYLIFQHREFLRAPIRVIFQPAEEVLPAGAAALAEAGILHTGVAALAVHVDPSRLAGTVGWLTGAITAARDIVHIDVYGKAGHSARPHLAHDAIAAAADVLQHMQAVVRRHTNPLHASVLSIGTIQGGVAPNIIASHVRMSGTLRSLSQEDRPLLRKAITQTAQRVAHVHDCTAEVRFELGTPPLRNDADLAHLVTNIAQEVLGKDAVERDPHPSMGAEDFGMFSDFMPTFYLRLGCAIIGETPRHLHEEGFDLDESCIRIGARVMARAMFALSQHHAG